MSSPFQFQLGLELTNIFPVSRIADFAINKIISLARDLRKSGSDFLIKEELADIFGRGRINQDLERKFTSTILSDNKIVTLRSTDGSSTGIVLDSCPGPTLQRALTKDPTKAYFATIIQISLLTWMHERNSLATCIAECMEARFKSGAPGASETSGVEAIHSMLDTCSSQTGAFQWSNYVNYIEQRITQSYHGFQHRASWVKLTPKLLLACMDFLYILQRLPNDRVLVIDLQLGFITVVIWAYYCLDLRVVISGVPGGDIFFGNSCDGPAHVVIKWSEETLDTFNDTEACLYDKDMQLVLEAPDPGHTKIEACERLPLQDYGTTVIHRWLNTTSTTERNATVVTDSIQYILAMAIITLPNLVRFEWDSGPEPVSSLQVQRWQIYNVAKVIFSSASYSETAVESYVKQMRGQDALGTVEPPPSLMRHWDKVRRPGRRVPMQSYMIRLSTLIIVLASVSGIELCGQLPLIADPTYIGVRGFVLQVEHKAGPHLVKSTDLYHTLVQAIVGGYNTFVAEETATEQTSFMVSEYGWTIFLSSVGAKDPSLAVPEQLFLRKGVPTKESTKERRFRVRDANSWSPQVKRARLNTYNDVLNRGKSYVPECAEHVIERAEFYGTTRVDFRLNIRHTIEVHHTPDDKVGRKFEVYSSYRAFHEGLWRSILAPPCSHGEQGEAHGELRLPLGVAASNSLDQDEEDSDSSGESEQTCVALVKDDPDSRWLAVVGSERSIMIRGRSTCIPCAIQSAASLPGKWTVVI